MNMEEDRVIKALAWSLKWTEEYMQKVCLSDHDAWDDLRKAKEIVRVGGDDSFADLPPGYRRKEGV